MKQFFAILVSISVFLPLSALACDSMLRNTSAGLMGKESFKKDCEFQDRYDRVKNIFSQYGRNIEDVTEYRALRFINQQDYLRNLQGAQVAPQKIYNPAPATWVIWSTGVDEAVRLYGKKKDLLKTNNVRPQTIAYLNKILMERDGVSVKDKAFSEGATIGVYRNYMTNSSGYCITNTSVDQKSALDSVKQSVANFQKKFEKVTGKNFKAFVASKGGTWVEMATMDPGMNVNENSCGPNLNSSFMKYTEGFKVEHQITWLTAFVDEVLASYRKGQPLLAPLEFSAIVQKWIVSIHPFVDGNGRTSRGVQDIITSSFSLPFVPAGTLQNDVLTPLETYIRDTYRETERMLNFLENCADQLSRGKSLNYQCKSVAEHK